MRSTNPLSIMRAPIQFGALVCFVALAATFLTSFNDGRYLLVDVEEKGNPSSPDNLSYGQFSGAGNEKSYGYNMEGNGYRLPYTAFRSGSQCSSCTRDCLIYLGKKYLL